MAEQMQRQSDSAQQAGSMEETEDSIVVSLLSEGSTTPDALPATPALARLLTRATRINRSYEAEFDVSFSSMLLAFLASDDPLSLWFRGYVREAGIAVDALLSQRKLDEKTLERITLAPVAAEELEVPRRQTSSARSLFHAAQDFLATTSLSGEPLDVRHLMAAYIYRPVGHEGDLVSLRYDRTAWSNAFMDKMAQHYPAELEQWKEIHRQTFLSDPPLLLTEGPSTHIATDIWTTDDSLGYRAYAYAIYRFMIHEQTRPPLTISIQAPWGGGKTSLMRMIQQALDPDASREAKEEASQPRGDLTVERVLKEVDGWIQEDTKTKKELPSLEEKSDRDLLTVWFNAWKYENTREVWAGLVDAIMQQVAARLPLAERERFWLRLNLKRIDADRIRHRVYERIFRYWQRAFWVWGIALAGLLFSFALIFLTGSLTSQRIVQIVGGSGIGLSTVTTAIVAVWKYLSAKSTVNREPAAVSLSDYLDVPDYSTEIGFIHHVEADLRRVLDSVPVEHRPIVVFIDDLDRCSPEKVAQVVEAVNLFLGGDFPNCMFVMGMDAEMVAASLQAAHQDMIACLPPDAGIPVGWRFMDKFVQLPFLIPPAKEEGLTRYTTGLFYVGNDQDIDPWADQLAREAAERITTHEAVPVEIERLQRQHNLTENQSEYVRGRVEAQVVQQKLDEGIERFSDENPEIRRVITAATSYFRGNPRELKRFVNAFRLHYFLWWADRAQGVQGPTLDQLRRWTVLSMKWPEVIRWLRRSGGSDLRESDGLTSNERISTEFNRLKLIEDVSGKAKDRATWQQHALKDLRLTPDTTPWLNDDELLQFFYKESKQPEGQRLSDGVGKGLW